MPQQSDNEIDEDNWDEIDAINIIAKEKEMDVKSFLDALDPNGQKQQEINKHEDMIDDPDERDLKEDNERGINYIPVVASPDENIVCNDSVLENNVLMFDRICDARHRNDMKTYNVLVEVLESNSYIVVELKD